jgi:hypothetical protein
LETFGRSVLKLKIKEFKEFKELKKFRKITNKKTTKKNENETNELKKILQWILYSCLRFRTGTASSFRKDTGFGSVAGNW